jgi:hypothetical protein
MRRMTRVGLFCAGIALLAPRVFADAIMLEGKTFSPQTEVFLIEVEHGHHGDDGGGFTLEICKHCKAKGEGPFLFNPNLSQAAFGRDFFAPFSGVSSLGGSTPTPTPPTALLSGSINSIATTTTPSLTSASSGVASSTSAGGTASVTSSGGTTTTSASTNSVVSTFKVVQDQKFAANPEPATVFLLGTGLVAGAVSRRKLRRRS